MATQVSPPVVTARDLSIRYRARTASPRTLAVDGATFDLAAGEILAVVGEAGSGKSTLARIVALEGDTAAVGSPQITGGLLTVLGNPVRDLGARKRDRLKFHVGYLAQDAGAKLDPHLTAGESVAEPIYARDRYYNQRAAGMAVATLIDAVRLPLGTMNKFPHELSTGQRQRVAIARALILEPTLLVADDPTAGIDVTVRSVILDIIRDLQREREFSAFVVTGNLGEIERITDRLLVMHKGVIVGRGTVDEVLANPQHPYIAGLVRTRNPDRRQEHISVYG